MKKYIIIYISYYQSITIYHLLYFIIDIVVLILLVLILVILILYLYKVALYILASLFSYKATL